MKIAVIGYSGCGKSTIAKILGEKYGAQVLHLDTVHWLPGWQERPREEEIEIVKEFMDTHESWVIDGNYNKVLHERRMEEANLIVFMSFNRISCFFRAVKRYRRYRGISRDSMTEGCPEKIDREFASWLLYKGRTKKRREGYLAVLEKYPDKTVVIRNQKEYDNFVK